MQILLRAGVEQYFDIFFVAADAGFGQWRITMGACREIRICATLQQRFQYGSVAGVSRISRLRVQAANQRRVSVPGARNGVRIGPGSEQGFDDFRCADVGRVHDRLPVPGLALVGANQLDCPFVLTRSNRSADVVIRSHFDPSSCRSSIAEPS